MGYSGFDSVFAFLYYKNSKGKYIQIDVKVTEFRYVYSEDNTDACSISLESDRGTAADISHIQEFKTIFVKWGSISRKNPMRELIIIDSEVRGTDSGVRINIFAFPRAILLRMVPSIGNNLDETLKNLGIEASNSQNLRSGGDTPSSTTKGNINFTEGGKIEVDGISGADSDIVLNTVVTTNDSEYSLERIKDKFNEIRVKGTSWWEGLQNGIGNGNYINPYQENEIEPMYLTAQDNKIAITKHNYEQASSYAFHYKSEPGDIISFSFQTNYRDNISKTHSETSSWDTEKGYIDKVSFTQRGGSDDPGQKVDDTNGERDFNFGDLFADYEPGELPNELKSAQGWERAYEIYQENIKNPEYIELDNGVKVAKQPQFIVTKSVTLATDKDGNNSIKYTYTAKPSSEWAGSSAPANDIGESSNTTNVYKPIPSYIYSFNILPPVAIDSDGDGTIDSEQNLEQEKAKREIYKGKVVLVGGVLTPHILSGKVCTLYGVGVKWGGNWFINKAVHYVSDRGYTIELDLERDGTYMGTGSGDVSSKPTTTGKSTSSNSSTSNKTPVETVVEQSNIKTKYIPTNSQIKALVILCNRVDEIEKLKRVLNDSEEAYNRLYELWVNNKNISSMRETSKVYKQKEIYDQFFSKSTSNTIDKELKNYTTSGSWGLDVMTSITLLFGDSKELDGSLYRDAKAGLIMESEEKGLYTSKSTNIKLRGLTLTQTLEQLRSYSKTIIDYLYLANGIFNKYNDIAYSKDKFNFGYIKTWKLAEEQGNTD